MRHIITFVLVIVAMVTSAKAAYVQCAIGDCLEAHGKETSGALVTILCADKGTCPGGTWPNNDTIPCYYECTATPGAVGQWGRSADAETIDCCQTYRADGCHQENQPCYVVKTLSVTKNKKWFVTGGSTITLSGSYSGGARAGIGDLLGFETNFTVAASWDFEVSGGYERSIEITQTSSSSLSAPCCGKTYYDAAVWTRNEPVSGIVKFRFGTGGVECYFNEDLCYTAGDERIVTDSAGLAGTNAQKKYCVCDLTCLTYNGNCCASATTGTMGACGHLNPPE